MLLLSALNLEGKLPNLMESLLTHGAQLGWTLIKAALVLVIGKMLINMLNLFVRNILSKRKIDPSVKGFIESVVNVTLIVLLAISVVGALGLETTSFAALLASMGVAIGMALSGNLSNFAGGLIILLLKPYKVGDYIEAQGNGGTVQEIQIFHTILRTSDHKTIYIPNGSLSSGAITNYNRQELRRVEWVFGIEYGTEFIRVREVLLSILEKDPRILSAPAAEAPFIALKELADSSVNIVVRAWVRSSDYWGVYFDINREVYETFNQAGIGFPFPQVTVHRAQD